MYHAAPRGRTTGETATAMPPLTTQPQLTPLVRHRLKEKFPSLDDADLPLFALSDDELVQRIARRTHRPRQRVRRVLEQIGAIVQPRKAGRRAPVPSVPTPSPEESLGSGVPDDTSQCGMMSMGPGW